MVGFQSQVTWPRAPPKHQGLLKFITEPEGSGRAWGRAQNYPVKLAVWTSCTGVSGGEVTASLLGPELLGLQISLSGAGCPPGEQGMVMGRVNVPCLSHYSSLSCRSQLAVIQLREALDP